MGEEIITLQRYIYWLLGFYICDKLESVNFTTKCTLTTSAVIREISASQMSVSTSVVLYERALGASAKKTAKDH